MGADTYRKAILEKTRAELEGLASQGLRFSGNAFSSVCSTKRRTTKLCSYLQEVIHRL